MNEKLTLTLFFTSMLVVNNCFAWGGAPHEKYRGNENYRGATCNFTSAEIRAMGPKKATEWARACREIARTNREWAESEREWTKRSRSPTTGVGRDIERALGGIIRDAGRAVSRDLFR